MFVKNIFRRLRIVSIIRVIINIFRLVISIILRGSYKYNYSFLKVILKKYTYKYNVCRIIRKKINGIIYFSIQKLNNYFFQFWILKYITPKINNIRKKLRILTNVIRIIKNRIWWIIVVFLFLIIMGTYLSNTNM